LRQVISGLGIVRLVGVLALFWLSANLSIGSEGRVDAVSVCVGIEGDSALTYPRPPFPNALGEGGSQLLPSPEASGEGSGVRARTKTSPPHPPSPEKRGGSAAGFPALFIGEKGTGVEESSKDLTPPAPLSASREGGEPSSPSPFTERGQGGEVKPAASGEGRG